LGFSFIFLLKNLSAKLSDGALHCRLSSGGNKKLEEFIPMQNVGATILATVLSVLITLIVTLVFNKLVAMPAAIRKEKEAHRKEIEAMKAEQATLKAELAEVHEAVNKLPGYRTQSLCIQDELRAQDNALLETCRAIQTNMTAMKNDIQGTLTDLRVGQETMHRAQAELQQDLADSNQSLHASIDKTNEDLVLLKKSKKDELRIQLINQYHLFTDPVQNPTLAWSDMEYHAFDQLVQDYEKLGGNDYIHGTVLPAMNELEIIPTTNVRRLEEVMNARHAR
jgi:hypothetical protein